MINIEVKAYIHVHHFVEKYFDLCSDIVTSGENCNTLVVCNYNVKG